MLAQWWEEEGDQMNRCDTLPNGSSIASLARVSPRRAQIQQLTVPRWKKEKEDTSVSCASWVEEPDPSFLRMVMANIFIACVQGPCWWRIPLDKNCAENIHTHNGACRSESSAKVER